MTTSRRSAVVALLLMGSSLAGAQLWRPDKHLTDTRSKVELESMFPRAFGDWRVDTSIPVQLVAPDMEKFLAKFYNQTLSRIYVNKSGQRIMLSVAYGGDQNDATRAHRPEICYPAQGFQIVADGSGQINTAVRTLPVRQLVAKAGSRNEPITYWVVVGDYIALSGPQQKLAQLRYTTRGVIPDGLLVRVSSIDGDAPAAFALQGRFVDDISRAMPADVQAHIFGRTGA